MRRTANSDDRRAVLVEATDAGLDLLGGRGAPTPCSTCSTGSIRRIRPLSPPHCPRSPGSSRPGRPTEYAHRQHHVQENLHMTAAHGAAPSPFKQPRAVWAVAFACVVSFMGIGLVDPILPALAGSLHATPSQVSLLFTSYLVLTAVAMLAVGWISSRIGAKRTLIVGLILIVVFAALAGASNSIGGIVGFRAGWGLGNALFIAPSLAVIVASASGGFAGAIILYETAQVEGRGEDPSRASSHSLVALPPPKPPSPSELSTHGTTTGSGCRSGGAVGIYRRGADSTKTGVRAGTRTRRLAPPGQCRCSCHACYETRHGPADPGSEAARPVSSRGASGPPTARRSATRRAPRVARRPTTRPPPPSRRAPGRRGRPCCRSARRSGRRSSARR